MNARGLQFCVCGEPPAPGHHAYCMKCGAPLFRGANIVIRRRLEMCQIVALIVVLGPTYIPVPREFLGAAVLGCLVAGIPFFIASQFRLWRSRKTLEFSLARSGRETDEPEVIILLEPLPFTKGGPEAASGIALFGCIFAAIAAVIAGLVVILVFLFLATIFSGTGTGNVH